MLLQGCRFIFPSTSTPPSITTTNTFAIKGSTNNCLPIYAKIATETFLGIPVDRNNTVPWCGVRGPYASLFPERRQTLEWTRHTASTSAAAVSLYAKWVRERRVPRVTGWTTYYICIYISHSVVVGHPQRDTEWNHNQKLSSSLAVRWLLSAATRSTTIDARMSRLWRHLQLWSVDY